MAANPKQAPLRDREYLDYLRTERCLFTGMKGSYEDPIDPCHVGTRGKALKSGDDETLPLKHSVHVHLHQHGEVSGLRNGAPDWLIRAAFRAFARELYAAYKAEHP